MNLALFDFDGTITTKDTFLEFIKFYRGKGAFVWGMAIMLPYLIAFKLKLYPNWRAKERVITHFFGRESIEVFQQKADEFAETMVPKLVKSSAFDQIQEHKKQGDKVVIVSASAENWLRKWCNTHDIPLIATKLQLEQGEVTGRIEGKNCYGQEKVDRVLKDLNLNDFNSVYAYGDSGGDKELLALANHRFYRHFS